jgi:hypothetical protein
MSRAEMNSCIWRGSFLPNDTGNKIFPAEHFIKYDSQVRILVIVYRNPNSSVFCQ